MQPCRLSRHSSNIAIVRALYTRPQASQSIGINRDASTRIEPSHPQTAPDPPTFNSTDSPTTNRHLVCLHKPPSLDRACRPHVAALFAIEAPVQDDRIIAAAFDRQVAQIRSRPWGCRNLRSLIFDADQHTAHIRIDTSLSINSSLITFCVHIRI